MAKRTKRANGLGSVFPYSDGFRAVVSLAGGGRKIIALTKTRRDAEAALVEARYAQRHGTLVTETQTVEEYLTRFMSEARSSGRAYNTARNYESTFRIHVLPLIGRVRLEKLTPEHINAVLNGAREKGLADGTLREFRKRLVYVLERAVRFNYIPRNVAKYADRIRGTDHDDEKGEVRFLERDEARRLLEAVRGTPCEAAFVLALHAGLRRGEILGLRWSDVDFDLRTLKVARSIHHQRGQGLVASVPKTAKSRRVIDLSEQLVAVLKARRNRQSEARFKAGTAWRETGYVFTTAIGTPIHPSSFVRDTFRAALRRAELPVGSETQPGVRLHDLRHTFAALALADGMPLAAVSATLGHASIATTLNLYGHALKTDRAVVTDRMAAILGGAR